MRAAKNVRLFTALAIILSGISACSAKTERSAVHVDTTARAESVQTPANDDSIFATKIGFAKQMHFDTLAIGDRVVTMGKLFLGTPYVAGTLDQDSLHENLVMNLHGFDCVTFYENALGLARVLKQYPTPTVQNYQDELTWLRYRNGKNTGYTSRLHYSIDYFFNNEQKRNVEVITRMVGGSYAKLDERPINFMSTHRGNYKQLANNDSNYAQIEEFENGSNARKLFYYIPKENVAAVESKIQSGDIIGITTNIAGLDCSHTGIAVRETDGRIHFMHASSLQHKVIISEEPLADYLTHSSHQTGIIVNRPLEVHAHTLLKVGVH